MRKLSFVIPCYHSERSIKPVVDSIRTIMNGKKDEYEIILVNDHSPDGVWSEICRLAQYDSKIIGIDLTKNFGQHSALMSGYAYACGEIVISMDDDGQTPVEDVYKLIYSLEDGYDVVFAEYETIKQSKFRVFGSFLNEKMTEYLVNKPKGIKPTSFFVAYKFIIDEMLRYNCAYPYIGGLIYRATQNIGNVKVSHHDRMYGQSGYKLKKLIGMWINGFTAFSVKPLRVATFLGFISAFVGVFYGVFTIVRKLITPEIQMGYSSLLTVILFIGGIIMLLLGMIGEYVGRIYICINDAPQYVVREVVRKGSEEL